MATNNTIDRINLDGDVRIIKPGAENVRVSNVPIGGEYWTPGNVQTALENLRNYVKDNATQIAGLSGKTDLVFGSLNNGIFYDINGNEAVRSATLLYIDRSTGIIYRWGTNSFEQVGGKDLGEYSLKNVPFLENPDTSNPDVFNIYKTYEDYVAWLRDHSASRLMTVAELLAYLDANIGQYVLALDAASSPEYVQRLSAAGGIATQSSATTYIELRSHDNSPGLKISFSIDRTATNTGTTLTAERSTGITTASYNGNTKVNEVSIAPAGVLTKLANGTTTNYILPSSSGTLALQSEVAGKQNALVSGQNIKSINGQSVLGAGNLELGELFVVRMTRNNSNSVYTADKSVSEIYEASYTNGKPVIAVMRDINNPVLILTDCDPDADSYVFSAIESNSVTTLRWQQTDDYTYELETIALQPHLVSGTSIKTVNNESLLGGGNVTISGKSAYQSYVDTTTDSPVKTEAEWVASLKGEDGVSLGEVAIADNLTTDDATKVLSAKQGYLLGQKVNGNVSQLTKNLSATDYRAIFNNAMAGLSGKIVRFSISGIDAGTVQILNSSWSSLLEKTFIAGGNVIVEIPENAQHLIIINENREEIGHTTTIVVDVTISALQDGIDYNLHEVEELQGGLPSINIFNISELYPKGGTGGTNVYTEQAARNKVPAEKRKNGLVIAYLTSGGWVIEQSQYTSYDATDWQWSNTAWTPITPSIVNLNSVQRKSDAFADAGSARAYVPRNLRLNPLGLLVTYLLSDGWHLDICTSSTFNAGEQYWKRIVSGSSVNIDDGAISTAKLADKAVSMPKLADDVIFKMDYMMGEGKDAPSVTSVDLANIGWTYGAYIDTTTGQVRSLATQAVSELIPISPLTTARLFAKISGQNTDYRVIWIAFYNVSENGTVTFLQGKNVSTNWLSSVKTFMTPSNANAFRININNVVGGVQQAITSDDLVDENYSLSASVPGAFSMPKKDIVIPKGIVDLSNADNWQQGDFFSTGQTSSTAVWSVMPIMVAEGHKYLIPLMPVFDNDGHMIYQLRVVYMSDLDTILSTSELLWYANAVFTAPKNCKYIHIVAYGHYNQQNLLPSQMPITHLSIVDITEFCGSFKSADKRVVFNSISTRYGQGIAYHNGYIFHGWSNGDLDVFDEDFNLVASSTLSPATGESGPVHCNVLAFSDDFYENGDDFPVLWISNNGTSEQKMLGVRIQLAGSVLTLTNVYELPAPAIPDNHRFYTQYFDFHAKHLIVQSYESVSASNLNYCGSTLIEVYSYTDKLTSSSTLTKVSSADVFPRYYPFQGGLVADNHLFATIGTNSTTRMIASINLTSGVIDSMIDLESELIGLEKQEEVQGFAFFNGILLVASVHGLYLLTL